mmetsp:Transcript_75404/g.166836  ORF Transcript_75404/g.166836 Transcript_75404/m.166836 type:complete len:217 (+) Transcript_75404:85-735(+)
MAFHYCRGGLQRARQDPIPAAGKLLDGLEIGTIAILFCQLLHRLHKEHAGLRLGPWPRDDGEAPDATRLDEERGPIGQVGHNLRSGKALAAIAQEGSDADATPPGELSGRTEGQHLLIKDCPLLLRRQCQPESRVILTLLVREDAHLIGLLAVALVEPGRRWGPVDGRTDSPARLQRRAPVPHSTGASSQRRRLGARGASGAGPSHEVPTRPPQGP